MNGKLGRVARSFGLVAVSLIAWTISAMGQPTALVAQPRVVVEPFAGPGGSRTRVHAVRALSQENVDLVPVSELEETGEPSSESEYAEVASALGAQAFVAGRVRRQGRGWRCDITVRGGDGAEVATHTFRGGNLRRLAAAVRRRLWAQVGDAIESASPPAGAPGEEDDSLEAAGGVVVRAFEGPGGARARARVIQALEREDMEVVPERDAESAAEELEVDLSTRRGRAAVALELGVAAFVEGAVERINRRRQQVEVFVYNGNDGELLGEAEFRGRRPAALLRALGRNFWDELGDALARASAPVPEDEPQTEEEDLALDDELEEEDDLGPRPSPLRLAVDVRLFSKSLTYTDDLFGQLREYDLSLGPAVALSAEWFPAAHFSGSTIANLGIDFHVESSLLVESTDSTGNEFPTSQTAWGLGLRWRFAAAGGQVTPMLGYGVHAFRIEAISVDIPAPDVPDVDYQFARIGVEYRLDVIEQLIALELTAAYRVLLSTGQFESEEWFPRSGGGGLDARLALGYYLSDDLMARLGVDVRRYFFSINPEPGDNRVAGGALDQYLAVTAGVAWQWPEDGL